jgi:hypothetical protein
MKMSDENLGYVARLEISAHDLMSRCFSTVEHPAI